MKHRIWQSIALLSILLGAASFRFYGLAWDSGYLFHPDERKILLVASNLSLPADLNEFLSSSSPLNPKFFAYGSFPIYLIKILGLFAPAAAMDVPWRQDLVGLALLGRTLSVLFDLGTITIAFLLARRLYDAWVGLLTAACIALTVLHIQLSHFYAVDTLLVMLVVATMFVAAQFAASAARRDAVMIGVLFGLALATKVSAVPLLLPIVLAAVKAQDVVHAQKSEPPHQPVAQSQGKPSSNITRWAHNWLALLWEARQPLIMIGAVALGVFVITQPYALLDPVRFFGQIGTELLVGRGWLDYPYTRQYADTLPYIYPIAQMSVWGMGLLLAGITWTGCALFTWRFLRTREWRDGFILSWALAYFLIVGGQYAKYLRYFAPLLPFLFLMTASAFKRLLASQSAVFRVALSAVGGLVMLATFVYALAFDSIYSREHPWLEISKWIYANIPAHSTLALEHWDDALPMPIRIGDSERTPTEYQTVILPWYDEEDSHKLETVTAALEGCDYVVLATQRLSSTITRMSGRYPMASRYYSLLFTGKLGFELVASARNEIVLDGIIIESERWNGHPPKGLTSDALVWNWGYADESFTVYDHPLSLVFKKTRALTQDELAALLSEP